jgi:uncharacterized protein YfaS (alpha-2-macroglobulin family)
MVALDLAEVAAPGRPLELNVTARLTEGSGRPVERRLTAPVLPATDMIGIRPAFDGVLGEGETATFDLIGLSPDLVPAPMQVVWTLNRLSTRYQWYQQYGDWNWEPITTRERISTGAATLGARADGRCLHRQLYRFRCRLVRQRRSRQYAGHA